MGNPQQMAHQLKSPPGCSPIPMPRQATLLIISAQHWFDSMSSYKKVHQGLLAGSNHHHSWYPSSLFTEMRGVT